MLHKRRIKPLLQRGIIFLGIFFATLCLLSFIYLPSYFKKPVFVSPITSTTVTKNDKKQNLTNLQKHVEALLKQYTITYTQVNTNKDNTTVVKLGRGEEVIFSNTKNIESQISSLQLMLNRLTIDGEAFKRLDFRFDRPVISF